MSIPLRQPLAAMYIRSNDVYGISDGMLRVLCDAVNVKCVVVWNEEGSRFRLVRQA